jgi:hypothetical protein
LSNDFNLLLLQTMSFWPKKITFQDALVSSLWALIAWILWSLLIIVITFFSSWALQIQSKFEASFQWIWWDTSTIFPLILSLITFLWTSLVIFLTYIILSMVSSEKYKRSLIIFWQISLFWLITYIFFTPIYIYLWIKSYENILYIFIWHTLITSFWTSVILEIMNNYRNILIWIYGSFIWLFIASFLSIIIFSTTPEWTAKLFALVVILPLINFSVTFFKQLFELIYYKYNLVTNKDPLWDIFYQIEMEEKEELRLQEEQNMI